ncbi:3',5'-cyclic adenosine monophosphate phosphodiesterase CpdA [Tsuneonella dongtanensis]|uniref:3',5'-cyclic adenosine monophosphate phosphodiesterase CpdA n=1 Tax=Tsuneonella dongtanensis TaxID=692370 RepID=A0A1B2A936_9SPHN|nr:phosphodiesterase [Tsuneonella dongtanensis]ANY18588.1 3',5'-cyclic adenosine monophosphate phosphodiesterase CpdA [Tsuneonella dongtanensis]
MLIAQLTDIHIGFDPDEMPEELNLRRFRATLARLLGGPNRPDMLILSGDITDNGDLESFEDAAALVSGCPFPVWPMVGNHDSREGLFHAFPHIKGEGGFVHYAVDADGLRILLLDTLEPGRHGGAFCEARARWLAAELAAHPDTPTLIFMHHPPVVSGIDWMDPAATEDWIVRFGDVVEGHEQIRGIHCGHLHRPIHSTFRGIPLSVTGSCAPLVAMDLRPVDRDHPDGRDLITTEPPSYALHRWDGSSIVSHYEDVSGWHALAHYTDKLQPMIHDMFGERD